MKKSQKISGLFFFVIIGGALTLSYFQDKDVDRQLSECSTYTVAKITRVYKLRSMHHIEYDFLIRNKEFQADEAVNNFDTNESWSVDVDELSKRRLLLQVHCNDPKEHRILWDIPVPDTLRHVPANGWREMPFQRQK